MLRTLRRNCSKKQDLFRLVSWLCRELCYVQKLKENINICKEVKILKQLAPLVSQLFQMLNEIFQNFFSKLFTKGSESLQRNRRKQTMTSKTEGYTINSSHLINWRKINCVIWGWRTDLVRVTCIEDCNQKGFSFEIVK